MSGKRWEVAIRKSVNGQPVYTVVANREGVRVSKVPKTMLEAVRGEWDHLQRGRIHACGHQIGAAVGMHARSDDGRIRLTFIGQEASA